MNVSSTFDFSSALGTLLFLSINLTRTADAKKKMETGYTHAAEMRESVMPAEKTTSLYEFTVEASVWLPSLSLSLSLSFSVSAFLLGALTQLTVTQAACCTCSDVDLPV